MYHSYDQVVIFELSIRFLKCSLAWNEEGGTFSSWNRFDKRQITFFYVVYLETCLVSVPHDLFMSCSVAPNPFDFDDEDEKLLELYGFRPPRNQARNQLPIMIAPLPSPPSPPRAPSPRPLSPAPDTEQGASSPSILIRTVFSRSYSLYVVAD
ncbi:hypothetical protein PFISCL1PPCAC_19926 [Pristionchus fissidentatus]|uniref:Uncharacterized protein n=1 Tax=Pristionchus fissidentatus TaxID=1538716 RepID=A0AAV5WFM7_9BILA|nr:hypothetical protein PFISCL1PPCAC_19926 [Pristionchus fissidentatus]